MKELVLKNYRELIAFVLIVICVLALLIMDKTISNSLRQYLYGFIGICIGYLFK